MSKSREINIARIVGFTAITGNVDKEYFEIYSKKIAHMTDTELELELKLVRKELEEYEKEKREAA